MAFQPPWDGLRTFRTGFFQAGGACGSVRKLFSRVRTPRRNFRIRGKRAEVAMRKLPNRNITGRAALRKLPKANIAGEKPLPALFLAAGQAIAPAPALP